MVVANVNTAISFFIINLQPPPLTGTNSKNAALHSCRYSDKPLKTTRVYYLKLLDVNLKKQYYAIKCYRYTLVAFCFSVTDKPYKFNLAYSCCMLPRTPYHHMVCNLSALDITAAAHRIGVFYGKPCICI